VSVFVELAEEAGNRRRLAGARVSNEQHRPWVSQLHTTTVTYTAVLCVSNASSHYMHRGPEQDANENCHSPTFYSLRSKSASIGAPTTSTKIVK